MATPDEPQAQEPIDLFVRPEAARRVNRGFLLSLLAGVALLAALALQVKPFGGREDRDGAADLRRSPLPMNLDRLPDSYARLQEPKSDPPAPTVPTPKPALPPLAEPTPVALAPPVRLARPQPSKKPDPYEAAFKAGFFWQEEPGGKRQPATTTLATGATVAHDAARLQDRLRALGQLETDTHAAGAAQTVPSSSGFAMAGSVAASDDPIRGAVPHHSDWTLYEGSVIAAVLLTGVNSEQPGMVVAKTLEPVFDTVRGDNLIVPQGTRVIGRHGSDVETGKRRLSVVWHRLIFPDGRSIPLGEMPGADHHGVSGITGKVNNHWGRILSAAVLSSVLNIGARLPTQRLNDADSQLIVQEFGQGMNRAAQEVIRRELRILPTITVPGGTRINLMTNRDIDLRP